MLAMVAAADSASTERKKYSVFIYSESEPHAMYAIYKQTLTLCVLQYVFHVFWIMFHIGVYIFAACQLGLRHKEEFKAFGVWSQVFS